MEDGTGLWRLWQGCFEVFRPVFTEPGLRRFVSYVTGLVLDPEEHTVTQAVTSLGREAAWAAQEAFVERGRWDHGEVEMAAWRAVAEAFPVLWQGYRVVACDDTKVHRTSAHVWGTCTYHEYTARCPNRAQTVRAHNWVVTGALIPGRPWQCLPISSRLYFRERQVPAGERFVTKTAHAVALFQQVVATLKTDVLAVFDGAYALTSVIQAVLDRERMGGRIDFVSRLRRNARLYDVPPARRRGQMGAPRRWGERLPAPSDREAWWKAGWQTKKVFIYGRTRQVRWIERRCLWKMAGWRHPVTVVIAEVEGFRKAWSLVTSSDRLTGVEVVEVYAARSRQEDAFRDLKQRLGAEECRAWTKAPIVRTLQAQLIALTVLRLLAKRLDGAYGADGWWSPQPWYPHKQKPSVRDVIRLLRRSLWRFGQVVPPLETCSQVQPDPKTRRSLSEPDSHLRKKAG
jgi:hypothetical protein